METLPVRINCGGGAYTDTDGNPWEADRNFNSGIPGSTLNPISGTDDDPLYQTLRYQPAAWEAVFGPLTYAFDVPAGLYKVTLKFCEITAIEGRWFDVYVNGVLVWDNLYPRGEAGVLAALDKTYDIPGSTAHIEIVFHYVNGDPIINAILIETQGAAWSVEAPASVSLEVQPETQVSIEAAASVEFEGGSGVTAVWAANAPSSAGFNAMVGEEVWWEANAAASAKFLASLPAKPPEDVGGDGGPVCCPGNYVF